MGKQYEVVLNRAGVREMLRSDGMMRICEAKARTMVNQLGAGYEMSTHVGTNRVNASVSTASASARSENLKRNTILKALGAAK